jgi:uncharacterized RDD family membrane protein YckC
MRVSRRTRDQLILQARPWGAAFFSIVFILVGMGVLLLSSSATLTCERAADACTLERTSVIGGSSENLVLGEVQSAFVEERRSGEGGATYRVVLETDRGTLPFLQSTSSGRKAKDAVAQQINGFLGDPSAPSLVARQDDRSVPILFGSLFAGIGVLIALFGATVVTVSFDRFENAVRVRRRSLVRSRGDGDDLDRVVGVVIHEKMSSGKNRRRVYSLNLALDDGRMLRLSDGHSTKVAGNRAAAETVREFLSLPAVEERSDVMTVKDVTALVKRLQAKREEAFLGHGGRGRAGGAAGAAGAAGAGYGRADGPERSARDPGLQSDGLAALGPFTAGVPVRAVAVFIDFLVLAVFAYVLSRWGFRLSVFTLSWTLVTFLYYSIYEGATGATLGKLAMGLRVVRLDGSPITRREALVRNALRFVDGFAFYLVGGLLAMGSPAGQRLGDRLAGTVVVMRRSLPALRERVAMATRQADVPEAMPASPPRR